MTRQLPIIRANLVRNKVLFYVEINPQGQIVTSGFVKYAPGIDDGTFLTTPNMKDAERFSYNECMHIQTSNFGQKDTTAFIDARDNKQHYVMLDYFLDVSTN